MPAGLPDVDTLATYGGALANAFQLVDPTTDEDAAWRNLYAMNVAAMTQTAVRAVRAFTGHATTPGDPASNVHAAVWGNDNSLKPAVAHSGTGIYDITWATTMADGLGQTHSVNFRWARASVMQSDGTFRAAHAKVLSPNIIRVYTYSGTTLNDLVGELIVAWGY